MMFVLILQPPLRGLDKARDRRTSSVTARRILAHAYAPFLRPSEAQRRLVQFEVSLQ